MIQCSGSSAVSDVPKRLMISMMLVHRLNQLDKSIETFYASFARRACNIRLSVLWWIVFWRIFFNTQAKRCQYLLFLTQSDGNIIPYAFLKIFIKIAVWTNRKLNIRIKIQHNAEHVEWSGVGTVGTSQYAYMLIEWQLSTVDRGNKTNDGIKNFRSKWLKTCITLIEDWRNCRDVLSTHINLLTTL